jgi:MFS family permease
VLLWALLGCLAAQIWALKMTGSTQYDAYVMSRWFAGFCGAIPAVIGPRMIFDILFLHQRGRVFNAFHICLDFGAVLSPTVSAFTAARAYWPVEYWWNVGLLVCAIVLVTLVLEETAFDREDLGANRKTVSWLQSRIDTFYFGTRTVPGGSIIDVVSNS